MSHAYQLASSDMLAQVSFIKVSEWNHLASSVNTEVKIVLGSHLCYPEIQRVPKALPLLHSVFGEAVANEDIADDHRLPDSNRASRSTGST